MTRGNMHFLYVGILLAVGQAVGSASAEGRRTYGPPQRWEGSIAEYEEQDRAYPPPTEGLVFVGSSTILMWRDHMAADFTPGPVINRGFGGSTMNDALYFVERIVIPYAPRAVIVYAGENDLTRGIEAEKVVGRAVAFAEAIHAVLPETRIYFISAKPSRTRWSLWADTFVPFNAMLKAMCEDREGLFYVDAASAMLDENGMLQDDLYGEKDGLHMNANGYALWTRILHPILMRHEGETPTREP